jgi:signal transduction histidine kinase
MAEIPEYNKIAEVVSTLQVLYADSPHPLAVIGSGLGYQNDAFAAVAEHLRTPLTEILHEFRQDQLIQILPITVNTQETTYLLNLSRVQLAERPCYFVELIDISEVLEVLQERLSEQCVVLGHEIKGPVSYIATAIEILLTGDIDTEAAVTLLRTIAKESRNLCTIVDELNILSGIVRGELVKERLSLKYIFDETTTQIETLIKETESTLEIPENLPTIEGNVELIKSLITNLITNAIKYGGIPPEIKIEFHEIKESNMVTCSIIDNGEPFTEEEIAKLFEIGGRPRRNDGVESTGFGLFICKQIVKAHGGEIGVKPLSDGNEFYFTLPLARAEQAIE